MPVAGLEDVEARVPGYRGGVATMIRGLARAGGDLLDLTPMMAEVYRSDPRAFVMPQGHLSPWGNCLVAERVAAHLVAGSTSWRTSTDAPACTTMRVGDS